MHRLRTLVEKNCALLSDQSGFEDLIQHLDERRAEKLAIMLAAFLHHLELGHDPDAWGQTIH